MHSVVTPRSLLRPLRFYCRRIAKPLCSQARSVDVDEQRKIKNEGGQSSTTHFGFKQVPKDSKEKLVGEVFSSVAEKYDIMNDLMSGTLHRRWKDYMIEQLCPVTTDGYSASHIDVAGGTGDIAFRLVQKSNSSVRSEALKVTVLDINARMLEVGKERAKAKGLWSEGEEDGQLSWVEGNAEDLPFEENTFDSYTIAFGIRNCTNIPKVLSEAYRVLKPGGRFLCLEFSHVANPILKEIYDRYSFTIIPELGKLIANDRESYQYLVESIRKFPDQRTFERMIREAGFSFARHENMTYGTVALHSGFKLL